MRTPRCHRHTNFLTKYLHILDTTFMLTTLASIWHWKKGRYWRKTRQIWRHKQARNMTKWWTHLHVRIIQNYWISVKLTILVGIQIRFWPPMSVCLARNYFPLLMDLRCTYVVHTVASVRMHVTYATRRSGTPSVCHNTALYILMNARSNANNAARHLNARRPCQPICSSTVTPAPTRASTAASASTRSPTWRNTPTSIQVGLKINSSSSK